MDLAKDLHLSSDSGVADLVKVTVQISTRLHAHGSECMLLSWVSDSQLGSMTSHQQPHLSRLQ